MRWIAGGRTAPEPVEHPGSSVSARVQRLPSLLDCSSLPNGVVELVVDDLEGQARQLFDVQDGTVALVEPGSAVPWASIAGTGADWVSALGPERRLDVLRLTGDQALARRVIEAFPAQP
jgi:hypothetical protein